MSSGQVIPGRYIDTFKLARYLDTKLGKGTYKAEVGHKTDTNIGTSRASMLIVHLQMRHNHYFIYAREALTQVSVRFC